MGVSTTSPEEGIAVITVDFPPVNALPVQGWYDLAAAVRAAGSDPGVRCVVLAATGRGFNAGADIKEMQRTEGYTALVGTNRGCYEAFAAVYDCEVPVVAAVQGFCVGGGIGLVGNADSIVASDDATFGLPELDRGALGAATHLARLVPQHLMRTLYYTSRTVTADELHRHGSVWRVVPRERLHAVAMELAREIAAKDGLLVRLAKASINGIDPVDVRRSYRFEQGFTFEANLSGVSDRYREAFVSSQPSTPSASSASPTSSTPSTSSASSTPSTSSASSTPSTSSEPSEPSTSSEPSEPAEPSKSSKSSKGGSR